MPVRFGWGWRRARHSRRSSVSQPCGSPRCWCRCSSSRCCCSSSSRGSCRSQELRKQTHRLMIQWFLIGRFTKSLIYTTCFHFACVLTKLTYEVSNLLYLSSELRFPSLIIYRHFQSSQSKFVKHCIVGLLERSVHTMCIIFSFRFEFF